MAERPQPTSAQETTPLHERGGLTPKHWEEVVTLREALGFNGEKIVAYAQKVISGEFPDRGFHHRMYLGQRHWKLLAGQNRFKENVIKRDYSIRKPFTLPLTRIEIVDLASDTFKEAREYARFEAGKSYTLNDYLPTINNSGWIGSEWVLSGESYGWKHGTPIGFPDYTETINYDNPPESILSRNLLSFAEVPDPVHTSPETLKAKLLEIVASSPSLIIDRLKARIPELRHLHDSPHFGILEKPIPQAV